MEIMKRSLVCISLFLLLVGIAFSQEKSRIAVLDLITQNTTAEHAGAITEEIRNAFVNSRQYTVVDRTLTSKILEEWKVQQTLTGKEKTVKIGTLFNVRHLITGKVQQLEENQWQVSLVVLNAETGETSASRTVRHQGSFFSLLDEKIPPLAWELVGEHSGNVSRQDPASATIALGPQPMDAAMLKTDLFSGKKYQGKNPDGRSWRVWYHQNGESYYYDNKGFQDRGNWWLEGDIGCFRWKKIREGSTVCYQFIREGKGEITAKPVRGAKNNIHLKSVQ